MFLGVRALGVIAFAACVTATGACAVISGLDRYWKAECSQGCDGGSVDARVAQEAEAKAPPGQDATMAIDAPAESETGSESETGVESEPISELDAPSELDADATSMPDVPSELDVTSEPDVASEVDATVDVDAAPEAAAPDGAADAADAEAGALDAGPDCGLTSTVQNCTACGTACDTAHSVGASCNGATCSYSGCASGRLDCDRTPPNANGCETVSSTSNCGVCGQACNTSTGAPSCLGISCSYVCNPGRADCNASAAPDTDGCESFYDCAPRGTYNATEQLAACAAFTGDATKCTNVAFLCLFVQAGGVCSTGASQCYCWYLPNPPAADASAPLGLVQPSTSSTCMCPGASSPTWN
jgi:hypothetical protein